MLNMLIFQGVPLPWSWNYLPLLCQPFAGSLCFPWEMFLVVSSNSQHPSSARTQEPPEMCNTQVIRNENIVFSASLRIGYDII